MAPITVPTPGNTLNQTYHPLLRRNILFDSSPSRRLLIAEDRVNMILFVLQVIVEMCQSNTTCTFQDLLYKGNLEFAWKKAVAAGCITDICCMLKCDWISLRVTSSDVGRIVGPLTFKVDNPPNMPFRYNCMRAEGEQIPRQIGRVQNLHSTAEFILLVEKDSILSRLAERGFHRRFPCIMITGGHGGIATKQFLRKLRCDLALPVLGLFDGDINGLIALTVYVVGSMNLCYNSRNLVTPDIRWIGMMLSDIRSYNIPDVALTEISEGDLGRAELWLNKECFDGDRKGWAREIRNMIQLRRSASLESLDRINPNYLIDDYLPEKLKWGFWI